MEANAVTEDGELASLRFENARLVSLLDAHGIEWRLPPVPIPLPTPDVEASNFSATENEAGDPV